MHSHEELVACTENLHGNCTERNKQQEAIMAFITEKEELKPGLVLFRRGDMGHRMWYCG
jgi:hypothetical protein